MQLHCDMWKTHEGLNICVLHIIGNMSATFAEDLLYTPKATSVNVLKRGQLAGNTVKCCLLFQP